MDPQLASSGQGPVQVRVASDAIGVWLIAPPMPAFYNQPQSIDDLINHSVGRVLDLFDIDTDAVRRWQGATARAARPESGTVSGLKERKQ